MPKMHARGSRRLRLRSGRLAAAAVALVVGATWIPSLAEATHGDVTLAGSNFEIDTNANLKVNHDAPAIDWASVNEVRRPDGESGQTDNSFTQGSDEHTPVPVVASGGIPPSKSDLKVFGVYVEEDSPGFLNMFWSRVQDPAGTTNMDFEFNQKTCVAGDTDGCSTNGVTPVRTVEDVLITYNLSSGGSDVSLWLHRWITSGTCEDSQEGGTGGKAATSAGCWDVGVNLTDADKATGSINTTAIPGVNPDESDGLGPLSPRTFGEASVDLSAIFGDSCLALGSAYLKSRSSDTFTSAMKDFIAPAAIDIFNCTGSILVHKVDGNAALLGGAGFTITPGSIAMTETSPGVFCTANLVFGDYTVTESTVPNGYTGAGPQNVTVDSEDTCAEKTGPDKTFINNPAPGRINIAKTDDDGNALNNAVFTLYTSDGDADFEPGAGDTSVGTCTTGTPSNGACSFTDVPIGEYWLDETTVPSGYTKAAGLPQKVTVGLGTTPGTGQTKNLGPFSNPQTHKVIVIVCHEGTAKLAASDVTNGQGNLTTPATGVTLPEGVSEAELCGLGGFTGKPHGDKTLTVAVGSDAHTP
jgi:uncharacterized surface anchored protein